MFVPFRSEYPTKFCISKKLRSELGRMIITLIIAYAHCVSLDYIWYHMKYVWPYPSLSITKPFLQKNSSFWDVLIDAKVLVLLQRHHGHPGIGARKNTQATCICYPGENRLFNYILCLFFAVVICTKYSQIHDYSTLVIKSFH